MKKIEVVTRPEKLVGLKEVLASHNCQGMTVTSVMGCGRQKGYLPEMNFTGEDINLLPKIMVFVVVEDEQTEEILADISTAVGTGKNELPKVFESVSEDKDGVITVTLTNNSLESSEDVDIMFTNEGDKYSVSEARYIEGAMDAHNTFEAPEVVDEKDFTAYENTQAGVKVTLPACSVVTLRLSK